MTTPDISEYSYLYLFDDEYYSIIALELKEVDEIQAIKISHEWDNED
ncbi:5203_t:CDS:2, partial [Racocetra persica]